MRNSVNSLIRSLPPIKTWKVVVDGQYVETVMSLSFEEAMDSVQNKYSGKNVELVRVGRHR